VDLVVLEATSHALSRRTARLAHMQFGGAIITNITSEHLDFHHTIESYIDDKLHIVRQLKEGGSLVFRTSFAHKDLSPIKNLHNDQIKTYAFDEIDATSIVQGKTKEVTLSERKILLTCQNEQKEFSFSFSPDVYSLNLLAALTLARSFLGSSLEKLVNDNILNAPITGRYHLLYSHKKYPIIIDFAHTEKSFKSLFSFLKQVLPSIKIVVLFGCAGERDRTKREAMGKVASDYCHRIYLTNEDPRKEDETQIIDDIAKGILPSKQTALHKIVDRTEAVQMATSTLQSDEILLLLGKGHENSIEYYDRIEPYNELECAKRAIKDSKIGD
jgi:UDP-N-acetylmuramoyl-L-alanyl-D-glutamate--2,6-diaminopimelate ligase